MYRYTYIGYPNEKNVSVEKSDEIYYSVVGYHADNVFVYVETPVKNLDVERYVKGDFKPFPTGKNLFRMEMIFYCDDWSNDEILCLPVEEREPVMSIMMLDHDAPMLAYIGHHYVLQENGNVVWNRYYSIYEFSNILISVSNAVEIPAPSRKSVFDVSISSIIDATRAPINDNKLPLDDGSVGWRKIN
ncbi:MAG: hypothetical protein IKA74_00605 [Clostridia bacterium]|nr:hypothetical protein [Clostridia bacterium]